MRILFFSLFLIFGTDRHCAAQAPATQPDSAGLAQLKVLEDTLGFLAFLVVNDSARENRFAATHRLIKTLVKALKVPHSFQYPFERLRTVSIQYPADSTFRLFSWQLYVDENTYRYYGAIQLNAPELKLIPLSDRSSGVEEESFDVLPPEKWYGALCYNILPFDSPEGRKYLLFGFNAHSFFHRQKIVDVLTLHGDTASFGAPVFFEEDLETGSRSLKNRIVKTYSAEASFKMNYDESLGMIVFDHLLPMAATHGQGMAMVPDGTYEGYRIEHGLWRWVPNIEYEYPEDAPRPQPILGDQPSKDLFGKEKKKGGN